MAEKRKEIRHPVALQVSYLNRGALEKDLISDLSQGGVFVRTQKPLPIGTELALEVQIGKDDAPIHVRGKVVWLRNIKGPREGMGIQFLGPMGPILLEMVEAARRGTKR